MDLQSHLESICMPLYLKCYNCLIQSCLFIILELSEKSIYNFSKLLLRYSVAFCDILDTLINLEV